MEYITVSARTLDDAITEALVQLGVTSDQLDYQVIEKGSAGFLGIGMKQAVIKARRKEEVKKEEPEIEIPKADVSMAKETEKKEAKKEVPKKEHEKKDSPKREHGKKESPKKEPKKKAPVKEQHLTKAPEKKRGRAGKGRGLHDREACEKFVRDVLFAMDMTDVKVTSVVDEEGALSIDMEGSNMGILIGKRGQTLDSLQYLTNRVANKMQEGYVRVKLDTEDYRRRRKETLENLAKNIASKVKRSRRTVSLEPMNPYERRIIHSALQADPAVSTHSEGEEPYRRVVVTLVRNR
ncbi:KH domain-containing protein [Lachnospiraceae bacterium WCA-9-b2]|uniref:RNA-binding protein KhpB n=1 Tax=Sporofaciens musculi TaxID=2681861 RepID=A0A7X3MD26_9FIRM|nr:RNA-binding cell elongation regulator Jag/EloR [Sporofaciens musculi]MXP74209.1 KH domain-containing protein [Sporofaciens musculi]